MADQDIEMESGVAEDASKHNLLTIPPELAGVIFEFADEPTLLTLRKVSREILQRVEKQFLKTFFGKRAFLLSSEESLRALLAIVEDEKIVQGLEVIDLSIDGVPDPEYTLWELRDLHQPTTREITKRRSMKATWHQREWHSVYEKQTQDREKKVDLHLLTVIFCRLRRLNHSIEIRIVDRDEACEVPWGMSNLEWLIEESLGGMEDRVNPISTVLEAVTLSAMPLRSFVVRYTKQWVWLCTALTDKPNRIFDVRDAFRFLKKLHLMTDFDRSVLTHDISAFFHALQSASLVEDLSLQVRISLDWRHESYMTLVDYLYGCLCNNFPQLRKLDLQGYDLGLNRLQDIVAHHTLLEKFHFHGGVDLHAAVPDGFDSVPPHDNVDGYMPLSDLDIGTSPQLANFPTALMIASCTVTELQSGKGLLGQEIERE